VSGHWRIDPGVARDLADLVGWDPDAGAAALTSALGARLPTGSTAKLAAIAVGEVPPGADPEAIARRVVEDRTGGRPEVSWSCWGASTLMAALLETLADRPAAVAAIRRIDDDSPPVDIHSLVVADGLLCDPYFASVVAGPGHDEVERTHGGAYSRRTDEADGRWSFQVGNGRWGRTLDYRVLGPVVDRGDVAAFCAVSVTHSGAPSRPLAMLKRATDAIEAFTHGEGGAAVRTWTWTDADHIWEGTTDQAEHPDWRTAAEDFAARTGIPLA
jgi:hypothetical protein